MGVGQRERAKPGVCVYGGSNRGGGTLGTLNERFVLENDDHIQLCENSSCSRLGKKQRRQQMREEMQPQRRAVCVCVCVCQPRLPFPFDSSACK